MSVLINVNTLHFKTRQIDRVIIIAVTNLAPIVFKFVLSHSVRCRKTILYKLLGLPVLWIVAKGVALSRPFRWSEKLETYFRI